MLRFVVIALIAYLVWRFIRADFRRKFAPGRGNDRTLTVDTVKCPTCGIYVAEGAPHDCTLTK